MEYELVCTQYICSMWSTMADRQGEIDTIGFSTEEVTQGVWFGIVVGVAT